MKLIPNWSIILRRGWSIRFMAIAFVLTGAEALLPYLDPKKIIQNGWFAAGAVLVIPCAFIARLIAQEGITNGE